MISLAFDLDFLEGSYFQSFSRLFSLFFFFAWINRRIFSMEATPDARSLQDRALIGTSGGVRWLSSEKPLVARTPWTPQPSWSVRCQWTQDVFILDISQNPPNFLHTVRRLGGGMDASSSNDSPDRRTCIKGDAVDRCWWYSSWCFCRLKWAPKLCLTWPSHRMQQLTSLLATSFWECCSLAHETKTTSPSFFTKERLKWKEYVQGSFIPFG